MKRNKLIAFGLVILMCMSVLAPSLAWANGLSKKYNVSISGEYIKGIPAGVTVGEFLSSMREVTTVTFNSESKAYVCTGCTVTIGQRGSFYAVILGDVDGSGKVDTTDYLRIKQHCLNTVKLSGAFYEAADVDGNKSVDATDYLRIKGHFLGTYDLYKDSYLDEESSEEPSEVPLPPTRFENMAEVVKSGNFVDPLVVGYETKSIRDGADPFVSAYHNGKYYRAFLVWGSIFVSSFNTLEEMTTDGAVHIVPENLPFEATQDIWSPKMYFVDGHWYVYYSASDGNLENHRMYVLKSKTSDAMGQYEFVGKVTDSTNKWAANGSVFEYKNQLYFTWSGWEGNENVAQNIYIAKMSSPTTISSDRVCLSIPERNWEIQGGSPLINDVPCAISSGDYLTLLYSASGSWCDDYCIGQLLFMGGDVLDPANWAKQEQPILKTDSDRFYAPGNCCVTTDNKGVMWMVFHANKEAGKGWDGRSIFMKPIRINENGVVEVIYGDIKEAVKNAGFADPLVVGYDKVVNPVGRGIADPTIAYHDGKYYWYFTCIFGAFISSFDSLDQWTTDNAVPVDFSVAPVTDDIWAPELHFIDGHWYIYYTAGKDANHRMYVLRSRTSDVASGFEYAGQINEWSNKWAIDASVFEYKGEMYFTWSGWEGDTNVQQNIYIAKMSSPTTLSSERVCISVPTYDWEKQGGSPLVNEGPYAIVKGDYLSILYSASGSWCDDYCIGQLLFEGGDVLNPNNWRKHSEPILQKDPDLFYGPGHCCVTTDEKGVLWLVFHATIESGSGWNSRSTYVYPLRINEKGIAEVIITDRRFEDMSVVVKEAGFKDPLVTGFTKITNPICGGADPGITYHDGKYYWPAGFLGIILHTFDSLSNIDTSHPTWLNIPQDTPLEDVWAPEMYFIDGYWYVYYSAGKDATRRTYALKSKTSKIEDGFDFVGQVTDWTNKWAIDGSVFEYQGKLYFIWSGWEGDVNVQQNIYIARMSSPTQISTDRICISVPWYDWEKKGAGGAENYPTVNEGPCAITRGDYLTILYSASGSWCDDYCIGQLLFRGGDILNPRNWEKLPQPILQKDPNWFYGPGHCGVVPDENGVLWMTFHANDQPGTGWNGRSVRAYPIRINEQGKVEVILYK